MKSFEEIANKVVIKYYRKRESYTESLDEADKFTLDEAKALYEHLGGLEIHDLGNKQYALFRRQNLTTNQIQKETAREVIEEISRRIPLYIEGEEISKGYNMAIDEVNKIIKELKEKLV